MKEFLYTLKNGIKDCLSLVIIFLLVFFIFVAAYFILYKLFFIYIAIVTLFVIFFTLYFFRNPDRKIRYKNGQILSPADGKVLSINKQKEKLYLKSKAYRIVIFMNIFNVHRNRIPMTGKVEYLKYKPGKFFAAFRREIEDVNEQMIIGIRNRNTKILFKQIAGLIARRVVCLLKKGDRVKAGELFGMIKFGSALIVYIPEKFKLKVKEGEKVVAGISVLASLKK